MKGFVVLQNLRIESLRCGILCPLSTLFCTLNNSVTFSLAGGSHAPAKNILQCYTECIQEL